jgi:hypothetical protein
MVPTIPDGGTTIQDIEYELAVLEKDYPNET